MNRIRHAWHLLTWKPTWHRIFYNRREYLIHDSALTSDPKPLQFRWEEPWHIGAGQQGDAWSSAFLARVRAGAVIERHPDRVISLDVA